MTYYCLFIGRASSVLRNALVRGRRGFPVHIAKVESIAQQWHVYLARYEHCYLCRLIIIIVCIGFNGCELCKPTCEMCIGMIFRWRPWNSQFKLSKRVPGSCPDETHLSVVDTEVCPSAADTPF